MNSLSEIGEASEENPGVIGRLEVGGRTRRKGRLC